jgi:hypothetical protein
MMFTQAGQKSLKLHTQSELSEDFNNDGTVSAADYIVWRNGLGTTYTQACYHTWRANFGQSAIGAAAVDDALIAEYGSITPEPGTLILLSLATPLVYRVRRRDDRMPSSGQQASRTLPAQRSAALAWRLLADLPG